MKHNFVAKHCRINKGGKMVDRRKQMLRGVSKHKKPYTQTEV